MAGGEAPALTGRSDRHGPGKYCWLWRCRSLDSSWRWAGWVSRFEFRTGQFWLRNDCAGDYCWGSREKEPRHLALDRRRLQLDAETSLAQPGEPWAIGMGAGQRPPGLCCGRKLVGHQQGRGPDVSRRVLAGECQSRGGVAELACRPVPGAHLRIGQSDDVSVLRWGQHLDT